MPFLLEQPPQRKHTKYPYTMFYSDVHFSFHFCLTDKLSISLLGSFLVSTLVSSVVFGWRAEHCRHWQWVFNEDHQCEIPPPSAQRGCVYNCVSSEAESARHSFNRPSAYGFFIHWYLGDRVAQDRFPFISPTICTCLTV